MCTCNERQKHVVATRRTADDVVIKLWSTGEITTNFGAIPNSVGKSPYGYVRAQAVRVNWLVDFALYDWRELSVVITAYRNELRKVWPRVVFRSAANSCCFIRAALRNFWITRPIST